MHWLTLSTMIFSLGTIFGGLIFMLGLALFKHESNED